MTAERVDEPTLEFKVVQDHEVIRDIVILIRENPSVNLTQFNNYVATLSFTEQAKIRYFIYQLALLLSEIYDIDLGELTENQLTVLSNGYTSS